MTPWLLFELEFHAFRAFEGPWAWFDYANGHGGFVFLEVDAPYASAGAWPRPACSENRLDWSRPHLRTDDPERCSARIPRGLLTDAVAAATGLTLSDRPPVFEARDTGRRSGVVAVATRDPTGRMTAVQPLLDHTIDLGPQDGIAREQGLQRWAWALSAAVGEPVHVELEGDLRCRVGGEGQARELLVRLLDECGADNVVWVTRWSDGSWTPRGWTVDFYPVWSDVP